MRTLKELFTAEDLERLSYNGRRLELVKGKVYEMAPAGARHGEIALTIGIILGGFIRLHRLGRAFAAETGFIINRNPDTVRAPDMAFVSGNRLGIEGSPEGYFAVVPDLVVEVVSPGDSSREVEEKVADWLRAGVRLVWVIYPASATVSVFHSLDDVSTLQEDHFLDGGDVVPGFTCRVGDLFA